MARRWRHWFRVIHRDVGYVAVALTIAYCLSGLAVNHIEHWNPSYAFDERAVDIGPLPDGELAAKEAYVIAKLAIDRSAVRGHFMDAGDVFRVYLVEGQEASVDTRTGKGTLKVITRRAVLFEINALHLNNLKGVWTYVADLFAIALMLLAITGMTMMKGDRGLSGRGKWFVGAGLLIPVSAVIYMYL